MVGPEWGPLSGPLSGPQNPALTFNFCTLVRTFSPVMIVSDKWCIINDVHTWELSLEPRVILVKRNLTCKCYWRVTPEFRSLKYEGLAENFYKVKLL